MCNAEPGRYLKVDVSECGCVVVAADRGEIHAK